jgi:predicted enzyme related to lactoylglutathione lyase
MLLSIIHRNLGAEHMAAHGTITWTELNTRDVAKAKAFCREPGGAAVGWMTSSEG